MDNPYKTEDIIYLWLKDNYRILPEIDKDEFRKCFLTKKVKRTYTVGSPVKSVIVIDDMYYLLEDKK